MFGKIVFIAVILLTAVSLSTDTFAYEEISFTATGGIRLPLGTKTLDAAANGNARIQFIWLDDSWDVTLGFFDRVQPTTAEGGAYFLLRSWTPPRVWPAFLASPPDSAYVILDTASEVILTCGP